MRDRIGRALICLCAVVFCVLLLLRGDSSKPITVENEGGCLAEYSEEQEGFLSEYFALNPGTYHFTIAYEADMEGNSLKFTSNGIEITDIVLIPKEDTVTYSLTTEKSVPALRIMAEYAGKGYLRINSVHVETENPWYIENWLTVLFVLLVFFVLVLCSYWCRNGKKDRAIEIGMVCAIAMFASSVFLCDAPVGHGDDIEYHLTRIEGIAEGLQDGQIPVTIYPDRAKENGYLNAMYPSLFLYFPAVLRLLGVSLLTSYKVLLLCINFGTAFAMYVAMKCLTKSRKATLLATFLYTFCGYRLNNMLVRSAVGETLAMIFLPLIVAGLYQVLFDDKEKWWMLVLGATGVLQSHILSTGIYAVIAFAAVCVFRKDLMQNGRWLKLLKAISFCVAINLFFVIPFIVYSLKGNLNLSALANQNFTDMCLSPASLLGISRYTTDNVDVARDSGLHASLAILLGFSIFCMLICKRNKAGLDRYLRFMLVIALVMLFGATNWFPYEYLEQVSLMRKLMRFLQFSWRLVGPAVAIIIMAGAVWLTEMPKMRDYANGAVVVLTCLMLVEFTGWNPEWEADMYDRKSDLQKIHVNIMYTPAEYLVGQNQNWLTTYETSATCVKVTSYQKERNRINATYMCDSDAVQYLDFPLLCYLGYEARDEKGKKYDLSMTESGNIRVHLYGDGEEHSISVRYKEPIVFRVAETMSICSAVVFVLQIRREKGTRCKKT